LVVVVVVLLCCMLLLGVFLSRGVVVWCGVM
jgi:hypothetical protein